MIAGLESKLRDGSSQGLHFVEAVLYIGVGILLSVAAAASLVYSAISLWNGISGGAIAKSSYAVLDEVLAVLVLIEILHTVRMSARSQHLITEPFLIVGIIASVRRVLVITMEAAELTKQPGSEIKFQNSMIELGVLGGLIAAFVVSIWLLRRGQPQEIVQ